MVSETGEPSLGFFLAFQAFPTILMRVSGAEAFCVSSNIFFDVESALTIRPHLNKMTQSELHTVLTAGMATVASSMLATYVFMLHTKFPTIAGHLISASILSAPAALVMSKILLPESQEPETLGIKIKPEYVRENSWIESIISGAGAGVKLVVGIVALAPDRTSDLARVGFRALLAATLTCLMTAAIAGTFYNGSLILMVK
jgi:CNT family concentrative nucleoside transporter